MKFSYTFAQPLTYSIGPKQVEIVKVKHGVTEVSLSDGRVMRLTLHLESVSGEEGKQIEVSYQVVTELMTEPELPILDVHERVQ